MPLAALCRHVPRQCRDIERLLHLKADRVALAEHFGERFGAENCKKQQKKTTFCQ